jgi:hypothetical protein
MEPTIAILSSGNLSSVSVMRRPLLVSNVQSEGTIARYILRLVAKNQTKADKMHPLRLRVLNFGTNEPEVEGRGTGAGRQGLRNRLLK